MRSVITLMFVTGFIALAASTKEEAFEDNSVDDVYDNTNEDEITRVDDPTESGDEEDVDEEAAEYFFEKLFNRGKDVAGRVGNRTRSGRGSDFFKRFFQRKNGTRGGDGGGRGGRRGGGGFKKFLGEKTRGASGSSVADGSPQGGDFLRKLMEQKMGSRSGEGSTGGSDFLKKYLEGKSPASYAIEDESL